MKFPWLDSHPWLDFDAPAILQRLGPEVWMLLGEAKSKCEHIAGVPLMPHVAQEMHRIYLTKGVQATTAIEGNTLTEQEVRKRIEQDLSLPPSKEYLGQEIDNIVTACNQLMGPEWDGPVTSGQLEALNAAVLEGLPLGESVLPGRLREHNVGVGSYRAPDVRFNHRLVDEFCAWLARSNEGVPTRLTLHYAILRAVLAHLYFVWIHPFGDGNGRTARLLEVQILLSAGVPTPAAHLLSNHYNETRSEYYRRLELASRGRDPSGFVLYAVQGFVDQLQEQLKWVRSQQLSVTWESYVYAQFRGQPSPSLQRRRALVFALSSQSEPVPKKAIRRLSPELAVAYATKTDKTISRDLNVLVDMKLVRKVKWGYQACIDNLRAFMPVVKG